MRLRDLFTADVVKLDLQAESKDELLKELVSLLALDEKSEAILFKTLKRRENLGSTGIGKGIAIPHCRSLVVNRLRLAYGRKRTGMDFNAIDGGAVHNFFLIVAPPPGGVQPVPAGPREDRPVCQGPRGARATPRVGDPRGVPRPSGPQGTLSV